MTLVTGLSLIKQISVALRAEDVCPNDSHLSANAAAAQPQEFEGLVAHAKTSADFRLVSDPSSIPPTT